MDGLINMLTSTQKMTSTENQENNSETAFTSTVAERPREPRSASPGRIRTCSPLSRMPAVSPPSVPLLVGAGMAAGGISATHMFGPFVPNTASVWINNANRLFTNNSHGNNSNINNNTYVNNTNDNNNNNNNKSMSYSSPPPMASNPENNVCKLIDYRGTKVAAFIVEGDELLCLPQAFDLFLKHLVGGLHTVYTKLKRLDIHPVVCNVEQVRILRGLGAIQPGVNRCKLLSCDHFDLLYEDCTNSTARPGRPPKRVPPLSPRPDALESLKKSRLQNGEYHFDPRHFTGLADRKVSPAFLNGFPHNPYSMSALHFMPFAHPVMSSHATMGMMANQLGLHGDAAMIKERFGSEPNMLSSRLRDDVIKSCTRTTDTRSDPRSVSPASIMHNKDLHRTAEEIPADMRPLNLHINGQLDMSTSQKLSSRGDEDDDYGKHSDYDKDEETNLSDGDSIVSEEERRMDRHSSQTMSQQQQQQQQQRPPPQTRVDDNNVTPFDTLLLNIQGLLKVAAENARHHERQCNLEKEELQKQLVQARDTREKLHRKLTEEQRTRVLLTKRLHRERKVRRKVHERFESAQRSQNTSLDDSPSSSLSGHPDTTPEREVSHHYDNYPQTSNSSPTLTRFPFLPLIPTGST